MASIYGFQANNVFVIGQFLHSVSGRANKWVFFQILFPSAHNFVRFHFTWATIRFVSHTSSSSSSSSSLDHICYLSRRSDSFNCESACALNGTASTLHKLKHLNIDEFKELFITNRARMQISLNLSTVFNCCTFCACVYVFGGSWICSGFDFNFTIECFWLKLLAFATRHILITAYNLLTPIRRRWIP